MPVVALINYCGEDFKLFWPKRFANIGENAIQILNNCNYTIEKIKDENYKTSKFIFFENIKQEDSEPVEKNIKKQCANHLLSTGNNIGKNTIIIIIMKTLMEKY